MLTIIYGVITAAPVGDIVDAVVSRCFTSLYVYLYHAHRARFITAVAVDLAVVMPNDAVAGFVVVVLNTVIGLLINDRIHTNVRVNTTVVVVVVVAAAAVAVFVIALGHWLTF